MSTSSLASSSDDSHNYENCSIHTLSEDEQPNLSLSSFATLHIADSLSNPLPSSLRSDTEESVGSSSSCLMRNGERDIIDDDDDDNDGEIDDDDEENDEQEEDTCEHMPSVSYDSFSTCARKSSHRRNASSSVVLSSLKKGWKGVKRAGVKSTASAGKSLSSISSSVKKKTTTSETWEERNIRMGEEWVSIMQNWEKKRKTARVRTLMFRGVPVNVRGRVWQLCIGNALNISEGLFDVLKERAYTGRMEYIKRRQKVAQADGDLGGIGGEAESMMESERSAHKAIMLDLPRTFPELTFFHAEGSHYEFALRDVLEAFLYLKPDVGYSQGMSFLAAVLLLYMDPFEAFVCFSNMLLHKSCFLHFFTIKMPEVRCYMTVHEKLLSEEMPSLYQHFRKHRIESDLYMINWVMSLYCHALPLDTVTRVWDVYVLDGDVAIFRAALGILKLFQAKLMKMNFEEMAYFLSHVPKDIKADELLSSMRTVRVVTKKRFRDLFKEAYSKAGEAE